MKKTLILGILVVMIVLITGTVFATDMVAQKNRANCNVPIETKKEVLDAKVKEGIITREKADQIVTQIENCEGTGTSKIGQNNGVSFCEGKGQGKGQGKGMKNGTGANCAGMKCTVTQ